ncbi:RagB/SusD family nutrient uptake outer membrane protein [uncultured Prevotella sp.]|uniref:RagB/SusD family nutrient uptake outer membrane protein n=1 Tax=uncultured Prevotella sp. TaxID=159272 RepID=UPI00266CF6CB|nr:RagB/SusD family nutrient uptake outer membrane protein [uncultured Prevotella sp.]
MRIRIIYIMMIACTMLQSCDDFFDKTGDDSNVTAGKFFKDETAFMQALTGIYMQMRAPELYGNTLSLGMMEFASQTLEPYDEETAAASELHFDAPALRQRMDTMRICADRVIESCDRILLDLPMDGVEEWLDKADRLLSANDPIMNATNPSSVKVGEIDRRLRTFQLNAYAVKALKARVALWKGDYQKALDNADSVMLHTDPARVATRYQLFYFVTPGKYGSDYCFSRENIFALSSLPTGFTRLSATLFDQKKVRCRTDIDRIYAQQTDIRRRAWFREQEDGTQIMSNKYGPNTLLTGYVSTESGGSTDLPAAIPYIRLGEVQLIAAEALWRLDRKQEARQRLIAMQSSKDVTYAADASEDADLLPMIYDEYRRDLFGDGQLYYLNKRISR